jgi:PAS domain S-box-containing protein
MFAANMGFNSDRYKAIIDNMIDGFAYQKILFDENNTPVNFEYVDINQSFEILTGLKRSEVINKTVTELFPTIDEVDVDWIEAAIKAALYGENIRFDTYAKPLNKWFSCSLFSYEYGYFAVIFHDITESKISNEKLRKNEKKYRGIFNSVHDSIFIADFETGAIIDANPAACELYGYTKYEMLKLNRTDFVVDLEKMVENIQNNILHLYIYHKKKDGTIFPVDMYISECIYNERLVRILVVRDITDYKLVEELKKEIEKNLTIINESKIYENLRTEFFANISHELRTPLNVILGSVQLVNLFLDDENKPINITKLKKYPRIIQQNCFRLLRLINNLIDITKIDSGYLDLNLENRNIVSVIEDITLSVAEYIQNKEINLIFDTETEERLLAVDSDMIERIMLNLLSNAIKFTQPGGSIYVNLYEANNNFVISVKDTGIGIPEDKLDKIFNRFTQVDKSLTRSREGSGIGLSLVKSLVELHDGTIKAISSFGYGSEFIIKLPIKINASKEKVYTQEEVVNQAHVERIHIEFSDIYA